MSCPLGETGVGKMGEMPPNPPHELRRKAPATSPRIVSGRRPRGFTAQSLSEQEEALAACAFEKAGAICHGTRGRRPNPIESKIDCGGSKEASICRYLEHEPCRRMPALRLANAPLPRPLPQLRLPAVALKRGCIRRVPGLA